MIPAVIYREGKAQSIKLSRKEIVNVINKMTGEQVMVDLQFANGDKKIALLKDYQIDPIRGELIHSDFFEVSLTEEIVVTIPIVMIGEPVGVKRDGGILNRALREVEIECLPDKIPDRIELDISQLGIGQSVHVSDLKLAEGITIINDPGEVIVNIAAPAVEAAPAEEAAAAETAEPELVKKGKKEEGEEKKEK